MQKVNLIGHLVQKLEQKPTDEQTVRRTDGGDCFTVCVNTVGNKKHLKNVGPIRHNELPHANSPGVANVLSHAACASMSTTTTTTRDRGDRYGPME